MNTQSIAEDARTGSRTQAPGGSGGQAPASSTSAGLKQAAKAADSFEAGEALLAPPSTKPSGAGTSAAPATAASTAPGVGAKPATEAAPMAGATVDPKAAADKADEAATKGVDAEATAVAFNAKFKTVVAAAFGGPLTGEQLLVFFSAAQVKMLADFIATDIVPKSLFISAPSTGKLTAQQRILIASTILAQGKVAPTTDGGEAGGAKKAHAEFCGHWTRWVYSYAGVTPPKGMEYGGAKKLDLVGPTGEISLGGGKVDEKGEKGPGAFVKGGREGERAPVYKGDEVFEKLQPGDWLYLDNGNPAGHSVIFVGWLSGIQSAGDGARFRRAQLMSQLNNNPKKGDPGGGSPHASNIGYPYSKAAGVFTVTAVHRVTADSAPPTTADQLLVFNRDKGAAGTKKNIDKHKFFFPKKPGIDPTKLNAALVARANELLGGTAMKSLAPAQRTLCEGIIAGHNSGSVADISELTALIQRFDSVSAGLGANANVDGIVDPVGTTFAKFSGRSLESIRSDA